MWGLIAAAGAASYDGWLRGQAAGPLGDIDPFQLQPPEWAPWSDTINGYMDQVTVDSMSDTLFENGVRLQGPDWDLPNPRAMAALDARRNQIVGLGDDLWENELRPELVASIARGDSIDDAALRLDGRLDEFYRGRARTIARTTIISATNAAQHEVGVQFGFGARVWLATSDGRTRPTHAAASGQRAEEGEPFIVGGFELAYPGDPSGPPQETIQCRCTHTYPDLEASPETVDEYQAHTGAWHAMSEAAETLASTAARVRTVADRAEYLAREMRRLQWHNSRENLLRLAYNQSTDQFTSLFDQAVKDLSGHIDFTSSSIKELSQHLYPLQRKVVKVRNRSATVRRHTRETVRDVGHRAFTHRVVPTRVTDALDQLQGHAQQITEAIDEYMPVVDDMLGQFLDVDQAIVVSDRFLAGTQALREARPIAVWRDAARSTSKRVTKIADDIMAKGRDIDHRLQGLVDTEFSKAGIPTLDDLFDAATSVQSVGERIQSAGVKLLDARAERLLPDELTDLFAPSRKWRERWAPIEKAMADARGQIGRLETPMARIRETVDPWLDDIDAVQAWIDDEMPEIRRRLNVIGNRYPQLADRAAPAINAIEAAANRAIDDFVRPTLQIGQDVRRILDAADLMVDQAQRSVRTYERVGGAYARLFDEHGDTANTMFRLMVDVADAEVHATAVQLINVGGRITTIARQGRLTLRDPIKLPADVIRGAAKSLRYIASHTASWDESLTEVITVLGRIADEADRVAGGIVDFADLPDGQLIMLGELPDIIGDAITASERGAFPPIGPNGLPDLPEYLPVVDALLPDGARLPPGMAPISRLSDDVATFAAGVGDGSTLMLPVGSFDAQPRPELLQAALDLYGHADEVTPTAPGAFRTIARLDRSEAQAVVGAHIDDLVVRGDIDPPEEVLSRLALDGGPTNTVLHHVPGRRPPKVGDRVDLDDLVLESADSFEGGPVVWEIRYGPEPATVGTVRRIIDMDGLIVVHIDTIDDATQAAADALGGLLPAIPETPIAEKLTRRLRSVDTIEYHRFADERGRLELPQFSSSTIAVVEARNKARFDGSKRLLAELRRDLRDTAQEVADENRQYLESRFQGSGDRVSVASTPGASVDEWFYERLSFGERQQLIRAGFVTLGGRDRADMLADLAGETANVDAVMEDWVQVVQEIIQATAVANGGAVGVDVDVSFLERGLDDFDPNMLVKRRGPKGTAVNATTDARVYLSERVAEIEARDAVWALEAVDEYELGPEPWNMSFAGWRAEIFDLLDGETSLSDTQVDRRIEELLPPNLFSSIDDVVDMEQAHHEIVEIAIRAGRLLPS